MTDEYLRRHQRLTFALVTFMALSTLARPSRRTRITSPHRAPV